MVRLIRWLACDMALAVRGALWRLLVRAMGGRLGTGARVYGGARLVMATGRAPIRIGAGFRMLRHAMVNTLPPDGRIVIGDGVHLGEASMITAGACVEIGSGVIIGPHTIIVDTDHRFEDPGRPIREQGLRSAPIRIEDDAWLASHVTVVGGVTIGRGAVVGAGSVVTRDVPALTVAAGVPARVIGRRGPAPG